MKPFITKVSDYHDFKTVLECFRDAGFKLEYTELGLHNYQYHAIFYEDRSDERIQEMIDAWHVINKNYD